MLKYLKTQCRTIRICVGFSPQLSYGERLNHVQSEPCFDFNNMVLDVLGPQFYKTTNPYFATRKQWTIRRTKPMRKEAAAMPE